jgi:hypothetical protein
LAIIHIIQKDESSFESIITDTESISEISFSYPLQNKPIVPNDGNNVNDKPEEVQNSSLDILYVNGERRNIETSVPTVLRLSSDDELIVETTSVRVFEKAYLGVMSLAFEDLIEDQPAP